SPEHDEDRHDERREEHGSSDEQPAREQEAERHRPGHERRAEEEQRPVGRRPSQRSDDRGHQWASVTGVGASSRQCGSQRSVRGRYQFARPSSFIVDGRSTPRMIVASRSTAIPRPTPSCLMSSEESVANSANTPTITAAAAVTVPAVVRIPSPTPPSAEPPPPPNSLLPPPLHT